MTAPNRSWKQPQRSDPAVEAFIRRRYAAEYPTAMILKTGTSYKTWVERKGLSYIGDSYKRGWILVKMPNQPFCLASEWAVGRGAKGMTIAFLGGTGIFMKCQ